MTDRDIAGPIEEISEPKDRLACEWESLAERVTASPFLYPGFVLAWHRAFGHGPLHLATARRDGELVAALPLMRRGAVLASPANWHTPQSGVLAEDVDAATALATVVSRARARRISLAFVDGADIGTVALRAATERAGYLMLERTLVRSPYLDLFGDWAEFEAGMKSSTRRNLRRLRRRWDERGTLTLDEMDGSAQLDEDPAEVIRVEGLASEGRAGHGDRLAAGHARVLRRCRALGG